MKRTNFILSALFLFLSVGQIGAQEQKPYKPAAMFKKDTIAYLDYNYRIRSAQYAGKTVGEIIKELEYPVIYTGTIGMQLSPAFEGSLTAIQLTVRQMGSEHNPDEDYYIILHFEEPPVINKNGYLPGIGDFFRLNRPSFAFTAQIYNLIKDLKVRATGLNPGVIKDPEYFKRMKEIEKEIEEAGRRAVEQLEKLKKEGKWIDVDN